MKGGVLEISDALFLVDADLVNKPLPIALQVHELDGPRTLAKIQKWVLSGLLLHEANAAVLLLLLHCFAAFHLTVVLFQRIDVENRDAGGPQFQGVIFLNFAALIADAPPKNSFFVFFCNRHLFQDFINSHFELCFLLVWLLLENLSFLTEIQTIV